MAINPFLDCGDGWEDYDGAMCSTFLSGMDAMVLFKPGVKSTDFLTGTAGAETIDVAKIQNLLDTDRARIINGLMIGIDAPSAETSASYIACMGDTVSTYTRTATIKDRKVTRKAIEFWNSVNAANGFVLGGALIKECAANRVTYIPELMTLQGGRVSPEGKELQRAEFTLNWQSQNDPLPYADADIWDLVPTASGSGSGSGS